MSQGTSQPRTSRTTKSRASAAEKPRVAKSASADVTEAITLIEEITKGNLVLNFDSDRLAKDPLLAALHKMVERLVGAFGEILTSSTLIDRSSTTTNSTAKALRDNAVTMQKTISAAASSTEEMRHNMNSVSASTEELNANMQSIASAARQSNTNVDSVQVSIKELTTASREIAENTARATTISKKAMADVTSALSLVSELNDAAKAIDAVTATISEISDQTKLLALNATIEAARAGEMGKGFAVVAKEVKDLASQTNTATKGIQGKIGIIHEVARRTSDAISAINDVMKAVNEAVTSIAAAAEEQSVTTDSIGQNVVSTTERIKEMSNNVSEGAVAVQDVSKSILDVTNLSSAVAQSMTSLNRNASEVKADAAASYAQALEVVSQGADIKRIVAGVKLPSDVANQGKNATLQLCRFTQDFDVMSTKMNDDHKRIFGYINTIHQRIKEKSEGTALLSTLKELADFTQRHFQREEEAMLAANYAAYPQQKAAHTKLLAKVAEIINALESGGEVDLLETMTFLKDWLTTHILVMDREYGPVLRAHGID
jgi:hemerythrin-like metal-binding protein